MSLSFSPFFLGHFLAGCSDGSVRLYKEDCSRPIVTWEGFTGKEEEGKVNRTDRTTREEFEHIVAPAGVSSVLWSEHRPGVFYVLDTSGTFHTFDIPVNDVSPVSSECTLNGSSSLREKSESKLGEPSTISNRYGEGGEGVEKRGFERDEWDPPVMAMSCDMLSTGSRPKVVVALRGQVCSRELRGCMFRPPLQINEDNIDNQEIKGSGRGEYDWMADWLGAVL
ncbi:unnamed protein product [Choristocarpus tenellus]